MEVVHRGKQAKALHPQLAKTALGPIESIRGPRVQHEVGDEALGEGARRDGDGLLVTRDARDQDRAQEPVTVELLDPSFRELLRVLGRELESEVLAQRIEERLLGRRLGKRGRERGKEPIREEMRVRIDHREIAKRGLHDWG